MHSAFTLQRHAIEASLPSLLLLRLLLPLLLHYVGCRFQRIDMASLPKDSYDDPMGTGSGTSYINFVIFAASFVVPMLACPQCQASCADDECSRKLLQTVPISVFCGVLAVVCGCLVTACLTRCMVQATCSSRLQSLCQKHYLPEPLLLCAPCMPAGAGVLFGNTGGVMADCSHLR